MSENNKIMSDVAIEFLLFNTFGLSREDLKRDEKIKFAAINKAYSDMAKRVLKIKGGDNSKFRDTVTRYLMKTISPETNCTKILADQELEDTISKFQMCVTMERNTIDITAGLLQKWINMSYKYLCIIYSMKNILYKSTNPYANYALSESYEMPIDRYILKAAGKKDISWSKSSNYEKLKNSVNSLSKNSNDWLYKIENDTWINQAIKDSDMQKRWNEYNKANGKK